MNALLWAHVLLTTGGYVGLIAANAYTLALSRSRDTRVIAAGLFAWRRSSRIFGPLLLVGIVAGFSLAQTLGVPLGSAWLVATYALIAIAILVQALVMVPWQLQSNRALEAGALPQMTPAIAVLVSLSAIYTSIVWLMVSRP
jgi:hypothetical protein